MKAVVPIVALACLVAQTPAPAEVVYGGEQPEVLLLRMPDEPAIPADAFSEIVVDEFLRQHPEVDVTKRELMRADNRLFARQILGQAAIFEELKRCEEQTGVRVRVRFMPWVEAFTTLRVMSEDLSRPMVVQLGDTWEAYFTQVMGVIVGEPRRQTYDARFFWYSTDAFSEADFATGETFAAACRRVAREPPGDYEVPFAMACGPEWDLLHVLATLNYAAGAESILQELRFPVPHYRTDLAGPAGGTVMQWLGQLQTENLLMLADRTNVELTEDFLEGKYACIIAPPWVDHWAQRIDGGVPPGRIGAAWPPKLGSTTPATFLGGSLLAVFAPPGTTVNEVRNEQRVVDFFCSQESQSRYVVALGYIPADEQARSQGRRAELFERAVREGIRYPPKPDWPVVVENVLVKDELYIFGRRLSLVSGDAGVSVRERRMALAEVVLAAADEKTQQGSRDLAWRVFGPWALLLAALIGALVAGLIAVWRYRRRLRDTEEARDALANALERYVQEREQEEPTREPDTPPPWLAEGPEREGSSGPRGESR